MIFNRSLKIIFSIFFLLWVYTVHAQEEITINGTLTDKENGETLIAASIFVPSLST